MSSGQKGRSRNVSYYYYYYYYYYFNLGVRPSAHLAGLAVDEEDDGEGGEVEGGEDVLRQADVVPSLGGIVQAHEDVHKSCRVPGQGTHTQQYIYHGLVTHKFATTNLVVYVARTAV